MRGLVSRLLPLLIAGLSLCDLSPAMGDDSSDDWGLHAQSTFVAQYHPGFASAFRGLNSLDPHEQARETFDLTLYGGVRPWRGAELWVNPEVDQGFGLSNTLGIAGFSSGEAYKVGNTYPYFRIPRAFVRQAFDLGGDTEKVSSSLNQMSSSRTANRVVLTVGKFSVSDIFDTISFAHDPRNDFMNWSLVDAGTFDYAADAWGYTYGAAVEWYQGDWTLRAGLFDLSIVPNSIELDHRFEQFQSVYEFYHRPQPWGQPGMISIVGFLTRGRMGRFDDATALAQLTAGAAGIAARTRP